MTVHPLAIKHIAKVVLVLSMLSTHAPGSQTTTHVAAIKSFTGITLTVTSSGTYTISSTSPSWIFGGSIGQSLATRAVTRGDDALGNYSEISFTYNGSSARSGSIRAYDSKPVVLFTDAYLSHVNKNDSPFPHLTSYPKIPYHLSYAGMFARYSFSNLADESPWIYFDEHANTFILSAASNFMETSTVKERDGSIASGINPSIATLPQSFRHKTILVLGQGINNTYEAWGHALTDMQRKVRPANDASIALDTLGYWTDHGAAYYYSYNPRRGYAQTLLDVADSFRRKGIPLGYMELDSWWYPKGAADTWLGDKNNDRGGIYTYNADRTLFPDGLAAFQKRLGLQLETHSRWIDPHSPYRKLYTMSRNVSTDPHYWNNIATYLRLQGVSAYEQDWLNDKALPALNLYDPENFLNNMANAMSANDVTITYCMPLPRHFLQSSEYNDVTTTRVSEDHFTRNKWDAFLYTSRLAGALGLWPWSDVFMSTERDNLLLSTLSAGVVGVGDPIGAEDKANLFQTIRADGVIIKPDAPIVPLDTMYLQDARGVNAPMLASTYTDHHDMKASYVFAYKRGSSSSIAFQPAALGLTGKTFVYNYFTGAGTIIGPGGTYNDRISDTAYYIVVPIGPSGIAFLGDSGKFVSLGQKRIPQLSDNGQIQTTISFANGETSLRMHGYSPARPVVQALRGRVSYFVYNSSTHLFSFAVSPTAGYAVVNMQAKEIR